jgi:leucyl/phenylalanyl-tRNA--protein transferase
MVLTPDLVVSAYANGYFPMPHPESQEMCWFHPDPRAILPLDGFRASRSLLKSIRKKLFRTSLNEAFEAVIDGCADRSETWINPEIRSVFLELHKLGAAHSVEVWMGDRLVGGTYGLALRGVFFAESMFHRETDASKAALFGLVNHMIKQGMSLLEVQFLTPHLKSLGAIEIPAEDYMERLQQALRRPVHFISASHTA